MTGRLTTHVLDISRGLPAIGINIELFQIIGPDGEKKTIKKVITNKDGRVEGALLEGDTLRLGVYELLFFAGNYYRGIGLIEEQDILFDQISIRFIVSDEQAHYHIPLLTAPGGYSTYRGS